MKFYALSLFPAEFEVCLSFGVVGRAIKQNLIEIQSINIRDFTTDVHHTVDDRPFGGGDGMVMKIEPMEKALASLGPSGGRRRVIHMSPRGSLLTDSKARQLVNDYDQIVLICSRYAGLDQRFINEWVDEEVSIGDFVLSGGELPAAVLIDVCARLLPGVLGHSESSERESFARGRGLEAPQYTRPEIYRGWQTPSVLLSGNHKNIEKWKEHCSFWITLQSRPEMIKNLNRGTFEDRKAFLHALTDEEMRALGLFVSKDILEANALSKVGEN